jgi:hypothetical protein
VPLGGITKAGNRYLRQMLVVGAMVVNRHAERNGARRPRLVQLLARTATKLAAIALGMPDHSSTTFSNGLLARLPATATSTSCLPRIPEHVGVEAEAPARLESDSQTRTRSVSDRSSLPTRPSPGCAANSLWGFGAIVAGALGQFSIRQVPMTGPHCEAVA